MFEALPDVLTILATVDPHRPEAWKKKHIMETISKLTTKGRPVVVYVKGESNRFALPRGKTKDDVLADIRKVINGGSKLFT